MTYWNKLTPTHEALRYSGIPNDWNDWNIWNHWNRPALKTEARQSGITYSARVETGRNKENILTGMFLSSRKPTADSGGGTPNYKFPFFGLLTIGTDWNGA
jgi:hypothetical protein